MSTHKSVQCCSNEKERLKAVLNDCDAHSADRRQRHECYRAAARDSGRRAKRCMIE
jgi:hypothetical protein